MSLSEVRGEIDRIDDQIVALLATRQRQVRRAAGYKSGPRRWPHRSAENS